MIDLLIVVMGIVGLTICLCELIFGSAQRYERKLMKEKLKRWHDSYNNYDKNHKE